MVVGAVAQTQTNVYVQMGESAATVRQVRAAPYTQLA